MDASPKPEPDSGRLEGLVVEPRDPRQRSRAIESAFDYRGDVTIETTDGRTVEGYLFDRRGEGPDACVRVMEKSGNRVTVRYDQVHRLRFSDRDPAAGKSWENWVRRYAEKKMRGERADLMPEPLDER